MASGLFSRRSRALEERLVAVGGVHTFDRQVQCTLAEIEPEGAIEDCQWVDTLTVEAKSEGTAQIICGRERIKLTAVTPVRLEIKQIEEGAAAQVRVGDHVRLQALLYDDAGRELEVGKFTLFEWTASEMFESANDQSAGEFGICDTCYGMYAFHAMRPGTGSISARLGMLQGSVEFVVNPP